MAKGSGKKSSVARKYGSSLPKANDGSGKTGPSDTVKDGETAFARETQRIYFQPCGGGRRVFKKGLGN